MAIHFLKEVERLKKQILSLSALVEENVRRSVFAIQKNDIELANKVKELDDEIDDCEVEVEEECLKILALHQPVAIDLRFIIAVLKINNDLERIGDLAVNIAEQVNFISKDSLKEMPIDLSHMANIVQWMLKNSLDALVNMDHQLSHEVCQKDNEVDEINRQAHEIVDQFIEQKNIALKDMIHIQSIVKNLERIADHSTNIAEDVIYMIEGDIIRHKDA